MRDGDTMEEARGVRLEATLRELEAIYDRVGHDPLPGDGDRQVSLEETFVSQPLDSLAEIVVRVRALIAIREIEGGIDETLLSGLRTLLDDLIRLRGWNSEG